MAADRRGGGFSRGGPAAGGSFPQQRPADSFDRGDYNPRGPAADGSLGLESGERGPGHERRQERREERREDQDWADYGGDYYGGYYEPYDEGFYEGYYEEGGAAVYRTLPCTPNSVAMGGTIYYVCGSTWYIRAYSGGELVYVVVDNPTGH